MVHYYALKEMVQEKYFNCDTLRFVDKSEVSAEPICRLAICEETPGVVTYFFVASTIGNEFVYYKSQNW